MSAFELGRNMKWLWLAGLLAAAVPSRATTNLFQNASTLLNPSIDATAVINAGTINYSDSLGTAYFQMINTHHFTNQASGTLNLSTGLRYELVTNNVRSRAENFINAGIINVSNVFGLVSSGSSLFFSSTISGGVLSANATNIVNGGIVGVGSGGLIHYEGNNIDLSRALMAVGRAGVAVDGSGGGGSSNYVNAADVKDIWWAVGTNQVLSGQPQPLDLISLSSSLSSSFATSPLHDVASATLFGTNSVILPYLGFGGVQTYVRLIRSSPTNVFVSIVALATNGFDTNVQANVTFAGRSPQVQLAYPEFDIIGGQVVSNYLTFIDDSATLTNNSLAANLGDIGFRPNGYLLSRSSLFFGSPANSTLTNVTLNIQGVTLTIPNIIWTPSITVSSLGPTTFTTFTNSTASNNAYMAYGAEVGNVPNSFFFSTAPTTDPTNKSGRIELFGDNLNLTLARLRTDNTLMVQTTNLISNAGLVVDAPVIEYSVSSPSSGIVLTNFLPATVLRYNGDLFAYTALWTNILSASGALSNDVTFVYNLLFLDVSQLNSVQNVDLPSLNLKATNVVIENILNLSRQFVVDSPAITLNASNVLTLSANNNLTLNLASNNLPNTAWFTNFGQIFVPNQASFGSDRPAPWSGMVNRGLIASTATLISALQFDNTGVISASGGPISIRAVDASMEALTNVAALSAAGSITFSNNTLKVRNHQITTLASLNFSVTNVLTDAGAGSSNVFTAAQGFNLLSKPATCDLIGTTFASQPAAYRLAQHVWAADNRGSHRAGFSNNAAMGHLVLNPATNSLLSFLAASTSVTNALYVDYLELQGNALTNLQNYLTISSNFYLYFASANVPVTNLDGLFNGHLRWVRDFAGPISGIDVVFPDGQHSRVNQALIRSPTIDSDQDGIPNKLDPFPFDGVIVSNVTFTNLAGGLTALIRWNASAQTDYIVEYATQFSPPNWQRLLYYTNNLLTNATITVQDPILPGSGQRFYRVNYQP